MRHGPPAIGSAGIGPVLIRIDQTIPRIGAQKVVVGVHDEENRVPPRAARSGVAGERNTVAVRHKGTPVAEFGFKTQTICATSVTIPGV